MRPSRSISTIDELATANSSELAARARYLYDCFPPSFLKDDRDDHMDFSKLVGEAAKSLNAGEDRSTADSVAETVRL